MTKAISKAMAKKIARAWGDWQPGGRDFCIQDDPKAWIEPTTKALLARGLLSPTGERGTFPSGAPYQIYRITPAALSALRDFLTKEIAK
jgi:hypothetical protein